MGLHDDMQAVEFAHAQEGMARLTRAFYDGLVGAGFKRSEAMQLTQTWLAATVQAAATSQPPEGDDDEEGGD